MNKLLSVLIDLTPEVGAWSTRNFPTTSCDHSIQGVYEEFGELNHALLKKAQGIRGTAAEHDANAIDAIHDMAIFLLDFLYRLSGGQPGFGAEFDASSRVYAATVRSLSGSLSEFIDKAADAQFDGGEVDEAQRVLVHRIGICIGELATATHGVLFHGEEEFPRIEASYSVAVAELLELLNVFSRKVFNHDFADGVRATWAKVKQRDWVANPTEAHTVVAAEASTAV